MPTMSKHPFGEIFQENSDGSLSPKRTIVVNGVTFGPEVTFGTGVTLGGIDFHQYKHMSIAIEEEDGVLAVKGFYRQ